MAAIMEDESIHVAPEETPSASALGLCNTPPELLSRIEEHLDGHSLTSYATCCRYLRASGVRSMLYAYPVILKTAVSVRSFCDFMHADLTRRKPCLRSFTIDTPYPTAEDVLALRCRLAHVLINAPNISCFGLGRCLKDILDHSPALFSAIHSLPSLTTLTMESDTGMWPKAILQIRDASLTKLDVGYLNISMPDALGRHAATLQVLSVGADSIEAALGHITYANVRSLSWTGDFSPLAWDLSPMVDLFPNLEKLSARMKFSSTDAFSSLSAFLNSFSAMSFPYDDVRLINVEDESRHQWPNLRHLSGDLSALYMLSLDCPVDVLSITDNGPPLPFTDPPPEVLLLLGARSGGTVGVLLLEALLEKSPHLIIDFLVVELFIPNDTSPEQILNITTAWPVLIGRLTSQKILLHVRIMPVTPAVHMLPTVAEVYVQRGWNLEALGKAISASTRATKTIYVRTSWEGGHRTQGWANISGLRPDLSQLVELADEENAVVMEKTVNKMLFSLA